jgi:hypothetical protein
MKVVQLNTVGLSYTTREKRATQLDPAIAPRLTKILHHALTLDYSFQISIVVRQSSSGNKQSNLKGFHIINNYIAKVCADKKGSPIR